MRIDVQYECQSDDECFASAFVSKEVSDELGQTLADIAGVPVDRLDRIVVESLCGGCQMTAIEDGVLEASFRKENN